MSEISSYVSLEKLVDCQTLWIPLEGTVMFVKHAYLATKLKVGSATIATGRYKVQLIQTSADLNSHGACRNEKIRVPIFSALRSG